MVFESSRTPEQGNRLRGEKSPYLLQHAHNPVQWYTWGEEALGRARNEDRPIFLSIGYSTCHWCHVMERESFENEQIAALMNEHFVCIKIDREERPDLDEIYMAAVQAMTGQGGWPLSAFLTPELVPFYGGTYFPPDDRFGRPGFPRVLRSLAEAWTERREDIESQAQNLGRALTRLESSAPAEGELDRGPVEAALEQLRRIYDARGGGWGSAPKFPRADFGQLCLRAYFRDRDETNLRMVTDTLDAMARGGMYDHLGGGFARYSTDDRWLVPHFEKMLYDNAQLAFHCVEVHQLTGEKRYAELARGVLDYVLRDLTDPGGGFYCAEDADSEGVEGRFYVWSLGEIREVLPDDELALFIERFGVSEEGNWEGRNVLEIRATVEELSARHELPVEEVERRLETARGRLFERREARVRPGRDDKVLTAWNGLMIQALARASVVLDEERYAEAAMRAADFVLEEMRDDGQLLRRWREGEAGIPAYAEDHAMLVAGLLELYQARFRLEDLERARELHARMLELFADDDGALFNTRADQPDLLIRTKTGYDGSVPTANSVAAGNALTLFELTGEEAYASQAEAILRAFAGTLRESPLALVRLLSTLDAWRGERVELVLAGGDPDEAREGAGRARRGYHPDLVVTHLPTGPEGERARRLFPALEGKAAESRLTVHVCRGFACRKPHAGLDGLEEELGLLVRR